MAPNDASLPDESFIVYPINRVAGTIADRSDAEAAVEALLQAGIERTKPTRRSRPTAWRVRSTAHCDVSTEWFGTNTAER
jgi:hypothetical protein